MGTYPYYTEPTHVRGYVTNVSGNGARTTETSSTEQRLVVDAVDKIFLLEPNQHPLVTLLTNVGKVYDGKGWKGSSMLKKVTGNPEFKWFEDFYGGRYAKISAVTGTTGDITLTVSGAGTSSAYIFTVGDVVKNATTGENFLVATVASATTITAVTAGRGFGTTAAATPVAGQSLFIVGNVNEENGGARNVNSTQVSPQTNYTQIFKTSIAVSNTQKASKLYGGADLPYQRAKKGTEHALDIERAFWFSEKKSDTTTGGTQGQIMRSTGGILEFLDAGNGYVQNQGGPLTAPDMNTFLREGFTYGHSTKVLFAGGVVVQAINEISRGQLQTKVGDSTYGVKINNWQTAFGSVNVVHNPLFVEDYAGYAFLLDMDSFAYRFMEGRDTKLETNIQANDLDGQVDQYLTECGLQRSQAAKHAILKGVTA